MLMKTVIQRALREPLVHFLLAGLAVFLFFGWRGNEVDPESRTITIDEPHLQRLAASFAQTWQRNPTQAEIDALIRDSIKEEVYYREALRLGLDTGDAIIRRRLRSKMEFLAASEVESARPADAVLQEMLRKNPARYALDASFSFDQIYLGAAAPNVTADKGKMMSQSLAKLPPGGDGWKEFGEPLSVSQTMENATVTEISKQFGDGFADAIAKLPSAEKGKWAGPVQSGFGTHLVRIRNLQMSKAPMFSDVRQAIENDWRAETITKREAKAYQTLLDGYTIKIAKP